MIEAAAIALGMVLGAGILLAGEWWGSRRSSSNFQAILRRMVRASRAHQRLTVERANEQMASATAIAKIGFEAADRGAREVALGDRMKVIEAAMLETEARSRTTDEAMAKVHELIRSETLQKVAARIRRESRGTNPATPGSPMPRILQDGPWRNPVTSPDPNQEIAVPVRRAPPI